MVEGCREAWPRGVRICQLGCTGGGTGLSEARGIKGRSFTSPLSLGESPARKQGRAQLVGRHQGLHSPGGQGLETGPVPITLRKGDIFLPSLFKSQLPRGGEGLV